MPGFIHCLLENHEDLLKEALKLHAQACRNAEKAAGADAGRLGGDDIAPQLDELVQQELMQVNLMDPAIYAAIKQNAEDWYVPFESEEVGAQVKCMPIQQLLFENLDICRDAQQKKTEEKVAALARACGGFISVLDDLITCESYDDMDAFFAKIDQMDGLTPEEKDVKKMEYVEPENKKINIALRQREVVIDLYNALVDEGTPHYKRLESFCEAYKNNRTVIALGKDEHTGAFLKFIDKIVSFFKEHVFTSLWKKSGGSKLIEKVDDLLHRNKTNNGP